MIGLQYPFCICSPTVCILVKVLVFIWYMSFIDQEPQCQYICAVFPCRQQADLRDCSPPQQSPLLLLLQSNGSAKQSPQSGGQPCGVSRMWEVCPAPLGAVQPFVLSEDLVLHSGSSVMYNMWLFCSWQVVSSCGSLRGLVSSHDSPHSVGSSNSSGRLSQ